MTDASIILGKVKPWRTRFAIHKTSVDRNLVHEHSFSNTVMKNNTTFVNKSSPYLLTMTALMIITMRIRTRRPAKIAGIKLPKLFVETEEIEGIIFCAVNVSLF